jgi:hypothetical protein
MGEKQTVPINTLSPSAARLLLALVTSSEQEEFDVVIIRAGIRTWQTYLKAKQQLLDGGYVFVTAGKQYATLTPR